MAGLAPTDETLERALELDTLDAAVEAIRYGQGSLIFLAGPAGIGKSRLLAEARARVGGATTLSARGAILERDFPFGGCLQLLDRIVSALTIAQRDAALAGAAAHSAGLFDGSHVDLSPGDDDRLAVITHGLYWLTANLSLERPLLMLVDDAHWLDAQTLGFLRHLAERLDGLPVCLVVAARPGEPGSPSEELRALPSARLLQPAPLSPSAVGALVARARPSADPAFRSACARLTGGNPQLVRELIDELDRRGIAGGPDDTSRLDDLVPAGVASTIGARLSALEPAARALARTAAVLGPDVPLDEAAALAGLGAGDAATALEALAQACILEVGESGLNFTHPMVAAAVYELLAPGEAGMLHRDAARVLSGSGATSTRVAAHLARAPGGGERWALDALVGAAEHALRDAAPSSAVRWLRRALDEAADRPERARVLAALGRAELAAGDARCTADLATAVELEPDVATGARVRLDLARALGAAGDIAGAASTLEPAMTSVDGLDPVLVVELEAAWVTYARHVPGESSRVGARTAALLERARPSTRGERVLAAAAANHAAFAGEPHTRVRELGRRALDSGRLLADEGSAALTWTLALAALGWADDLDTVAVTADEGLADARRRGSPVGFATASHARAFASFHTGAVAEAAADCRNALEAHRDPTWVLGPFACVQLAWAELALGDVAAAEEALEWCEPDTRWAHAPAYLLVLEARGRIALARGRPAEALELLERSGERAAAAGMPNPAVVPWRASAVIAAARLGRWAHAQSLAAAELELARRFGASRSVGVALRSSGLAERGERGVELLASALPYLDDAGSLTERAHTLVELGAAQRRIGRRSAARETLRTGLETAERCGMAGLAARAADELDAAGAEPRERALRGPASLTPSELRVARMAAARMTNREIAQALFVTAKAVEFHLANVYRKLDISDRSQLAATPIPT